MSKVCFLCGEEITGKSTKEHIIGDSFLKRLNLKNKKFKFDRATKEREYSRLKLSAHERCNNEMGSRFEEYIISILETLEDNNSLLRQLHKDQSNDTLLPIKDVLLTWLAKIYIGLIYWESEFLGHEDKAYQNQLKRQLSRPLLSKLQKCFKNEWSFNVPSSIYYFRLSETSSYQLDFDFSTGLPLGLIYVKIHHHLLIACIADGQLTEEWFTDHQYLDAQNIIDKNPEDCLAYLHPVAHIWAVRENLPVAPEITYTQSRVTDTSRVGLHAKPPINERLVNRRAKEIYEEQKRFKLL